MDINKAQSLKIGQTVHFPSDRGDPAGSGCVKHVSETVNKNIHGTEYIWVTVDTGGHASVWPSNRL